MNVLAKLSKAGGQENEDLIWHNDRCVVVLDGSSGLKDSGFKASRFVKLFIEAFSKRIENNESLCDSVNMAMSEVHEEFLASTGGNVEILPSAAGIFVYDTGNVLQLLTLGDCGALIYRDETVEEMRLNEVERFDSKVIQRMVELHQETGLDICDVFHAEEIQIMLVENRKKMNAKDGYRVLAFNMKPVGQNDLLVINKNDVTNIILYSDGFESQTEKMKRRNWDFCALYQEMRRIEEDDSRLNLNPRFKVSDDASAILVEI